MSKRKPTNRRSRARQLSLPLKPQGKRHKPDGSARGIVKGKPETFPPGTAMGASGYPVYSLVLRKPHPRAARAIEKEMATWDAIRERQEAAEAAAKLIQLDQPLAGDSLDVKWAKGLLDFLPDDMRREIDRHVAKLTDEQVGWMDGFDDHWQEHAKVRAIIAMGVEFGFAVALARFREPLTAHAPQARELIKRLDAIQKDRQGQHDHLKRIRDADRLRLVKYGQSMMSKADRDAAICREFESLKATMPKVKDREEYLAEKAGFEDRKQVYNIRTKASGSKKK